MVGIVYFSRLLALPENNRVIDVFLLGNEDGVVLIYVKTLYFYPLTMRVVYYDQIRLKVLFHNLGYGELEMADIQQLIVFICEVLVLLLGVCTFSHLGLD